MKWLLIPTILLLTSCGIANLIPEPKVIVETEYIKRAVPIQTRPLPVEMPGVDWYVVNETNLEEFITRIGDDVGNVVFVAITPKGYENLALGISELRRYILQQQEIIVYYEQQLAPETTESNE